MTHPDVHPFRINRLADWTYSGGDPERSLTIDEMLGAITLHRRTNTAMSAARLYWEHNANNCTAVDIISIPAAITIFPGEIYRTPRSPAERSYHQLIYHHAVDTCGHCAAWKHPDRFSAEVRATFRPLRSLCERVEGAHLVRTVCRG
jgi:pimeloyl-ACP methyl ester carboxylesterase